LQWTQWQQTLEHADHARSDPRNEDNVQLCQATMPESRARAYPELGEGWSAGVCLLPLNLGNSIA
jgi:hypothetical protein